MRFDSAGQREGQRSKVIISPVKKVAIDSEIEVLQPLTLKDTEIQSRIEIMAQDLLVVAAYGLILPKKPFVRQNLVVLTCTHRFYHGGEGLLLSRENSAGDQTTGISIMQMEEGLDTGPVYESHSTDIIPGECWRAGSTTSIHGVRPTMQGYSQFPRSKSEQESQYATYAAKLTSEDKKIDWSHSTETSLDRSGP